MIRDYAGMLTGDDYVLRLSLSRHIYEFFVVFQSGFYKCHWYGYHFLDLFKLILKIYLLLQSNILFGKYRDFWILPLSVHKILYLSLWEMVNTKRIALEIESSIIIIIIIMK